MKINLSSFGEKLTARSGILELMDDLGKAMVTDDEIYMLGGGNPAHIQDVEKIWRTRMNEILDNGDQFERMVGNYDTPQGKKEFINCLANFLNDFYNWDISAENIGITNGSQSAFFFLFNIFTGDFKDGSHKKILFPLCPEYIGYADQGISENQFVSFKPKIDIIDEHTFKYYIDFDNLVINKTIGGICVSRPTNPTGNVLTDEEISRLSQIASENDIPLLIDNAYGLPFPGIIFTDANLLWNERIILSMSLSKIGLPSTRTGIIIADKKIISLLSSINAIVSLSTGSIGQTITFPLIKSGKLLQLSNDVIRPYYEEKSKKAINWIKDSINNDIKYYIHKSEGALFLWIWFKDLPITSYELYLRLKEKKVLIIPGHYFFSGMEEEWQHSNECVRITYSQDEKVVFEGIKIIAEEINKLYNM